MERIKKIDVKFEIESVFMAFTVFITFIVKVKTLHPNGLLAIEHNVSGVINRP